MQGIENRAQGETQRNQATSRPDEATSWCEGHVLLGPADLVCQPAGVRVQGLCVCVCHRTEITIHEPVYICVCVCICV